MKVNATGNHVKMTTIERDPKRDNTVRMCSEVLVPKCLWSIKRV